MTYPYTVILGYDDIVGSWTHSQLNSKWLPGRGNAIGLVDDSNKIVAGWTYSDWNGVNCVIDVVAQAEGWCTPEFLWMAFSYPFEQQNLKRVTSPVAATNTHCIKFVEWLGATLEATLKDACPTGDVLLYRLFKEDCRWIKQKPDTLPRIRTKNG